MPDAFFNRSTPVADHQDDRWSAALSSESPEKQADALRRVAAAESVSGIARSVVELTGSSDDDVRMWAAEALETSVRASLPDIPGLIQLLTTSADSEVCYWSATLLGRLGPQASAAVTALTDCLQRCEYLPAKERAVWALGQLGPAATAASDALQQATEQGPPRLARLAAHVLHTIRSQPSNSARQTARVTGPRQNSIEAAA